MSQHVRLVVLAALLIGCESTPNEAPAAGADSVWSVDLITILPGGGDEYVNNIRDNWAQARDIAVNNGDVVSFRALIAQPDSARDWDIILMTEYADSSSWANREAIFARIFESAEYERIPTSRPSSELREFFAGGVVLTPIVSSSER